MGQKIISMSVDLLIEIMTNGWGEGDIVVVARQFFCDRCKDSGRVGLFRWRVCPECDGNPERYFMLRQPLPKVPPPPGIVTQETTKDAESLRSLGLAALGWG